MSLPLIRGSIFVRSTRIGQLLTKVGTQKKEWGGMEMFLDKQVRARSPLMKYAYDEFREQSAGHHRCRTPHSGARVIVSTVATNLKDCAPFASLHREDLGPDDLQSWTALVQTRSGSGKRALLCRGLAGLRCRRPKLTISSPSWNFALRARLWMLGDYAGAKEHFLRARDLDTLRFRADSQINDINRSVASSSAGAELVDAESVFSKAESRTGSSAATWYMSMSI